MPRGLPLLTFLWALCAVGVSMAQPSPDYKPELAQSGKDVVWVPTPDDLVTLMLKTAKVTSNDYVIDLGAGDGKIAIAAAKQFGAKSLGIEYNPQMVKLAECVVKAQGVEGRTKVIEGDI